MGRGSIIDVLYIIMYVFKCLLLRSVQRKHINIGVAQLRIALQTSLTNVAGDDLNFDIPKHRTTNDRTVQKSPYIDALAVS